MNKRLLRPRAAANVASLSALAVAMLLAGARVHAQTPAPHLVDPDLAVRTAASGLTTPIGIAFLDENDWLVIEKDTGMVKRVVNGEVTSTVLDLAVNAASERGLLGIALHPKFASNRFVYLFWSCAAPPPPAANPYVPTAVKCPFVPALGADTVDTLAAPLLAIAWTDSSGTERGLHSIGT